MFIREQLETPQQKPKDNGHSKYPTSETVSNKVFDVGIHGACYCSWLAAICQWPVGGSLPETAELINFVALTLLNQSREHEYYLQLCLTDICIYVLYEVGIINLPGDTVYHVFLLKLCTSSYLKRRRGHDFLMLRGPEKYWKSPEFWLCHYSGNPVWYFK